ncbi:hypothetical protein RR46_01462 [Papilio xuthus]|uniref:Uncharacterized protein n=1 Tax=Papilio xuthus TaxID=66420 RepID=A0A0N1I369_PAPXU|nr:hypothetical protein RR46_01462 [Papilio xuthus]
MDENDLKILEKTLSIINGPDDIEKIIEKIIENKKKVKEEQDNTKESKLFKSYVLEIINNKNISPDIKFVFESLMNIGFHRLNQSSGYSEFDFMLREAIANFSPGKPGTENDTNAIPTLKVDDINGIIKYLLDIIKKHGATVQLIKILRDFSVPPKERIDDSNIKIIPINNTHILVTLDDNDLDKIKSYLVQIINDYGSNQYLVNILRVLSPKGQDDYNVHDNQANNYTFTKLNQKDLNILTNYILNLIEQQGPNAEFIEILYLIYEINQDVNDSNDNKNEQYVLEISKELKKLRDNNIIQILRNMDRNTLIKIYIDMLENIFDTPNINNDFTNIMVKLLEIYKKEDSPIKRYIILKWYEYLIRNKGVSYKILRNPDFINNLLELEDNNRKDEDVIITTEKYSIVTPHDYSDIDKILSELINNTLRSKQPTDDILEEDTRKKSNSTDESKPNLHDKIREKVHKAKSCLRTHRKYKDISKMLNKIKKLYRHQIDISNDDIKRILDIILVFGQQLKYENHRSKIPASLVIDELENRLLSQGKECKQSDTVKQIISTVVVHLRDIISYLKSVNFSKDEIMVIVKSTLEDDIMPDIKAISVQECTAAANKEILDALLYNVFAKTYEQDENIELINTNNNELEKLSNQKLLNEISKVKSMSTSKGETKK